MKATLDDQDGVVFSVEFGRDFLTDPAAKHEVFQGRADGFWGEQIARELGGPHWYEMEWQFLGPDGTTLKTLSATRFTVTYLDRR